MNFNDITIKYLDALRKLIDNRAPIKMKKCWCGDDHDDCAYCAQCKLNYDLHYCAECGTKYDDMNSAIRDEHIAMLDHDGNWFIAIGCEGFHRIKI